MGNIKKFNINNSEYDNVQLNKSINSNNVNTAATSSTVYNIQNIIDMLVVPNNIFKNPKDFNVIDNINYELGIYTTWHDFHSEYNTFKTFDFITNTPSSTTFVYCADFKNSMGDGWCNFIIYDNNENFITCYKLHGLIYFKVPANFKIKITIPLKNNLYRCEFTQYSQSYHTVLNNLNNSVDAINLLASSADLYINNPNLLTIISDDDCVTGHLNNIGVLETQHTGYKTTGYIQSENIQNQGYTIIKTKFNAGIFTSYANICYYDLDGNFVNSALLNGERVIMIPSKTKVRITVNKSVVIYKGYETNTKTSNDILTEQTSSKKILWLGTSITEGGKYPEKSCENLNATCINKSLGASYICTRGVPTSYVYTMGLSLSESIEEKRQKYKIPKFPEVTDSVFDGWHFKGASYESCILPYLDEIDAIVFEHGYNDSGIIMNMSEEIDWNSRDRTTYIGAFNYLLDIIFSHRKDIKIILATHFSKTTTLYPSIGKIVDIQTKIAEHYGFPLIEVWKYFPATDYHIPNSSTYMSEFNAKYTKDYNTNWYLDSNGNITAYQFLCPDTVHPGTDFTNNSTNLLTKIYTKALRDLI